MYPLLPGIGIFVAVKMVADSSSGMKRYMHVSLHYFVAGKDGHTFLFTSALQGLGTDTACTSLRVGF